MKRNSTSASTIAGRLCTGLAAATMALIQLPVAAEDIDLFVQPPPDATDLPNVLIILDNTANWEQPFVNEKAALIDTVAALPANTFRVGLMMFTETGDPNNNIDGGYVRAAVRDLTDGTAPSTVDTQQLYMNLLQSMHVLNDRSNSGKAGLTMMEAYYYFDGQYPRSGNNKVKTDYTGNTSGSPESNAIYALPGNALPQFAGTRAGGPAYNSPIIGGSCGKNFIIYISNGAAQDSADDSRTARNGLTAEGGNITPIPLSPSGSQTNYADEWARFMYHESPHEIVTFTLDVDKVLEGQGPGWTELLRSIALSSEGEYYDVSSAGVGDEIREALADIFSQIQGVNSVFASVSLPVSVNTEGTYLNQIYIGMFRPDTLGKPRWSGNLKQYKLGLGAGGLETQDADSRRAINNATGFITECARSFWTPTTADNYWDFQPAGSCLAVTGSANDNRPDGNIVEKGAHGYKLRAPATGRSSTKFKTCSAASCSTLVDLDTVTQTELGAASSTERDQLVDWAEGMDIDDEQGDTVTAERRPSIHGDVVHSRPVAVNMNTGPDADVSPEVVVFYGGNDGVLRATNGNRTADIGSVTAGEEMWAFVPPEFYPQIKRLRDNNPKINFFGNTFISPLPKPYGVDGPIIAHRDGSELWLFASLRRGGRTIYAFDVTTINSDPTSPTLKWRIGCPNPDVGDDTGCTTGLEAMGQTWSAPKILRATVAGTPIPVMAVGGGYDPCEDTDPFDPNTCSGPDDAFGTPTPKGNRIFVFNADTGAELQTFDTDRGVVADVFVVQNVATGNAKWIYAADLGGNIYRISGGGDANTEIGTTDPSTWVMTKIASLGCSTPGCDPLRRKFMMPLDVVQDLDGSYVILGGSGDREKPLLGFTTAAQIDNYFFKIVDRPEDPDWLDEGPAGANNCSTDVICFDSLLEIPATPADPLNPNPDPTDLLAHPKGWALEMSPTEQVVTAAITVFGTTTFSTHTPANPAPGACTSNLGIAKVYNIAFANAASANGNPLERSQEIVGGGLPPSPVAGMVTLDDGTTVPFLIGGETNSPLEGGEPIPSGLADQPKAQTYWYIHK